MAFKEVSRVEVTEIIRQWQARRGIHEMSRSTGLSRKLAVVVFGEALRAQNRLSPHFSKQ